MNIYTKLLLYISVTLCLVLCTGCQKNEERPQNQIEFLSQSNYGLYGENLLFKYNFNTCQYSINYSRKTFRMQSDNGEYVAQVKFDIYPKEISDETQASITYVKLNKTTTYNLKLQVLECRLNKMWLWDNEQKMGIVIPDVIYTLSVE